MHYNYFPDSPSVMRKINKLFSTFFPLLVNKLLTAIFVLLFVLLTKSLSDILICDSIPCTSRYIFTAHNCRE